MVAIGNIEFHLPWVLLLIPILIYGFFYILRKEKSKPKYLNFSKVDQSLSFSNWKTKLWYLPDLLKLLSLILLVVALSRPRKTFVNQSIKGDGIDIMLAMDVSTSMLAQDFHPDRLTVSKNLAKEFVDKRPYDRIGLVTFGGESFTQCPLTVDHVILKDFIEMQGPGYLADGTAIGLGLASAVNRLKDSKSKSKIAILLTDGVNNKGDISPQQAAELAVAYDIKVYCIGIGSNNQAPTPTMMNDELIFHMSRVELDEGLLHEISQRTGGTYFRAKTGQELQEVYDTIDKLEKSEVEVKVLKRYTELYRNPLMIGLFLLLLAFILNHSIFKIFP